MFQNDGSQMPSGRGRSSGLEPWAQELSRRISRELSLVIAQSVQRIVEKSIDKGELARRLGHAAGRRAAGKADCSEPGCGNPVLARRLCRSHYYKERYQSLKAGTLTPRRRKGPAYEPEAT